MAPCDRCGQPARRVSTAERVAVDLDLDRPTLLLVTVGVHRCAACRHYFRGQPPFLRPDACYTNRVVAAAVAAVCRDGMALRRVPDRFARDFWIQPSAGTIRRWCRAYRATFDFVGDYQPWVVREFSGVLCVDEVYQGGLALLLAVDPAAPDGDRLVGYQLVHGRVDATTVEGFLARLREAGIEPDEVITDGSSLYPAVLAKVWPAAAHQLCLFHEGRRVTRAALEALQAARKALPTPPALPTRGWGGPLRPSPPTEDPDDPAHQRWQVRQATRQAGIAEVHALAARGASQRSIATRLGLHRRTVRAWVRLPPPGAVPEDLAATWREARVPDEATMRRERRTARWEAIQRLAREGRSCRAIARQVGVHRVTVGKWLRDGPPRLDEPASPIGDEGASRVAQADVGDAAEGARSALPAPPAPWRRWEEVREVREALTQHRFLLLRRHDDLSPEQRAQVAALLASPLGPSLAVAHRFVQDWYALWHDEAGERRIPTDAQARYEAWRNDPDYRAVPTLRRALARMTDERFAHLGAFLHRPTWEATNNGAERGGRAFRHRQAPHFNLRAPAAIEGALVVAACQRKAAATAPTPPARGRSGRGRLPSTPRRRAVAA